MIEDKTDFIFNLLKDYIVESDILDYGIIQLEIYKDEITEFTTIPYSLLKEIEKQYNIISLSPQIKDIEGETFASMVLHIEEYNNGA